MKTFSIMGNRIQDLGGFDPNPLQEHIKLEIEKICKEHKKDMLLTSLSLGIEVWAAEFCLKNKIKYKAVIPFKNYDIKWNKYERIRYNYLLDNSTKKEILSEKGYSIDLVKAKEIFMIDESDVVYSFYNPIPNVVYKYFANGKKIVDKIPTDIENEFFIPI